MNNVLFTWIRKEFTGVWRGGRLTIFLIVCAGCGVLNPAMAKLTPLLLEVMKDQMAEMGLVLDAPNVTAWTSWEQYCKNIWMPLLIFVLMFGNIFTKEYGAHTLTPMVTKGLGKRTVLWGKAILLLLVWTVGYGLYFVVTYGYTEFYWPMGLSRRVCDMTLMFYAYSLYIIALVVFFSVLWKEFSGVLASMAAIVLGETFFSMIPKVSKYIPAAIASPAILMEKTGGEKEAWKYAGLSDFAGPIFVTLGITAALFVAATLLMKHKSVD